MTDTETRTQTHATFTLERTYDQPVARVWSAFADADVKKQWFDNPEFTDVEFAEDFRVGGSARDQGRTPEGLLSEFRARYTDIVEHERIVYAYDMWLDSAHASTSITTITFEPAGTGTLLTFTEQGVHLDGVHGPGPEAAAGREHGSAWLLGRIAEILAAIHD
jgi:uncharacterized protein YndB with AHSA1/START domain